MLQVSKHPHGSIAVARQAMLVRVVPPLLGLTSREGHHQGSFGIRETLVDQEKLVHGNYPLLYICLVKATIKILPHSIMHTCRIGFNTFWDLYFSWRN